MDGSGEGRHGLRTRRNVVEDSSVGATSKLFPFVSREIQVRQDHNLHNEIHLMEDAKTLEV